MPRVDQVAHNRDALLRAARRVFRDKGYAGASLDAVADAAGFTKGAVYSHFTSKADLFLSLLETRIEARALQQLDLVDSVATDGGPRCLAEQVFATSRADPLWQLAVLEFRVVAARDPALAARYAALHRRTVEGIVATLEAAFAALGRRPALPLAALAVAGLALDAGGFLEDLADPGSVPDDQLADLFQRLAGLPLRSRPTKEG